MSKEIKACTKWLCSATAKWMFAVHISLGYNVGDRVGVHYKNGRWRSISAFGWLQCWRLGWRSAIGVCVGAHVGDRVATTSAFWSWRAWVIELQPARQRYQKIWFSLAIEHFGPHKKIHNSIKSDPNQMKFCNLPWNNLINRSDFFRKFLFTFNRFVWIISL